MFFGLSIIFLVRVMDFFIIVSVVFVMMFVITYVLFYLEVLDMSAPLLSPQHSQFLLYKTTDGQIKIDVRFDGDTVWLSQKLMAELFGVDRTVVTKHLGNVFEEGELDEDSVSANFAHTATDGKSYMTKFYNLDAIIAVGYRVSSKQATQFRIWATSKLKEYIIKGFVIDDERLKNPDLPFDYFEELMQRIQDIRTSEKRFYRKIMDIYATSIDYDPKDPMSVEFFQTVQNKVHYAITGKTAAEIIAQRADADKPNMGLTNRRGSVIRKSDIQIAKNYLNEEELRALNNLVEQYLIFAEGQAKRRIPMKMVDWIQKLHGFLSLNDRDILQDAGNISHDIALSVAHREYEKYKTQQMEAVGEDDFDREIGQYVPSDDKANPQ